jgi:hypothetical protein
VTDDTGWEGVPGAEKVCPDWIYQTGVHWHNYISEGGVPRREFDYAHPSFQQVFMPRLKNLLEALADKYDKPENPFNFMACFGYGHWGEWHTMWSNYFWPSKQLKHDVLAGIVNLYADTFKHIDLSISYCVDTFNIGIKQPNVTKIRKYFEHQLCWDDPEDFKYRQASCFS